MAVFDWNFLRHTYNFTNLPSNSIAKNEQDVYIISYSFFSASREISIIDWGTDENYFSSSTHLVTNYFTLNDKIKDAVAVF